MNNNDAKKEGKAETMQRANTLDSFVGKKKKTVWRRLFGWRRQPKNRLKPSSQMKGMEVNTRTVVIVKSEPPLKKLKSALKDPNRISSQSKKAKKVTFMGIPDPTPNNSMVESSDSVARSESFSSKEDISSSKSSEADKKTYQHYIEKKKEA